MNLTNISKHEAYQLTAAALLVLVLASLLQSLFKKRRRSVRDGEFPSGPPSWPIIGHLHLLLVGCVHQTLAHVARSCGPILGLRLGTQPAIVVSSIPLARELLLTHDKIFANRPPFTVASTVFYGYNSAIIFSSYNPRWAMLRKIYTLKLFTTKRLHDLQHIRQEEVMELICRICEASHGGNHSVNVGECVSNMTANTTSRLVQSKCVKETGGISVPELMSRLEHETAPTPGDMIPWLKFLDFLPKRGMKDLHDRFDNFFESIISKRKRMMETCSPEELPCDFLQVLLSEETTISDGEPLTTKDIKGILLDIFAGGVDTAARTLEWAMAELLRKPTCLKKLQDEIDGVMQGKGRQQVTDEEVAKLPYLMNMVKEVFRMHPVVPLLVPRMSSSECKVGKHKVPKGTLAFVNVYAIGRDPEVWEEPDQFRPERFEGREVDLRGQHYELLPFGAGRRMCPGMRLGLSVVHVTLANLVRSFEWELPEGVNADSLDMSEKRGIAGFKAKPLLAIAKPRRLSSF